MFSKLLVVFLLLVSFPVNAQWREVGQHPVAGWTAYADVLTITRSNTMTEMLHLYDFKTAQTEGGSSYKSMVVRTRFDCARERSRVIAASFYSEDMGRGRNVFNEDGALDWSPIGKGTVMEYLIAIACTS